MNKISCDTIMDLIPLVKDNVASEESRLLVEEHIKTCQDCKELYDSFESIETKTLVMNEKNVISRMKKQIFLIFLAMISVFAVVGLALADSIGMFYNILIMPLIGILGYFAFSKKPQIVLIALLIFSYVWLLIKYIAEGMIGEGFLRQAITIPIYWSLIYTALAGLGIIIGFLLKYAFGKENSYEKY